MTVDATLLASLSQLQKDFNYLHEIDLVRKSNSSGDSCFDMDIILQRSLSHHEDEKVIIRFTEVMDLKTANFNFALGCSLYLQITNISSHQMEGINYQVREEENDMFSFHCKTIEIKTSPVSDL